MTSAASVTPWHLVGDEHLKRRWIWFVALGVVLVLLGAVAVGWAFLATIASVIFLGWLMLAGGILQAVHAFSNRRWGGFFLELLAGVLYVVVGVMMILNPAAGALALTLLIAAFLIVGGAFRIAAGLSARFHHQGWLVLHGAINVLLGILIWTQWPVSGLWVIGLFVGIDMIFNGWALIMLGIAAKNLRLTS
jgi:uncharacterized membrane protein HdeD (DUF308 family)